MNDLMQKKLEYLRDIKKITAACSFKGDETEADDYISMINKREYVLEKIRDIDGKLEHSDKEIQNQINEVIKEIVEMDKKNKVYAEKIKNSIGLKISEFQAGKKLTTAYHNDTLLSEISHFDSKS